MSRTPTSRRRVLLGTGALACATLLPPFISATARALPGPALFKRKNIDELTGQELATYEHSVRLLRADAISGGASALSHPALRQSAMRDSVTAGTPWDRHHLQALEARLQATDPARTAEVTVPYWDFTRPASGRAYPLAFERADSPLFAAGHAGAAGQLDPVYWSYHAYIATIRDRWEQDHGRLAHGVTTHVWIGRNAVEIRTTRARSA